MTIEQALGNRLVADNAAFAYTTCSHAAGRERFRIGFVLPTTITDPDQMGALLRRP
jgi:hypothetical protein